MESRGQKRADVVDELPADKRACNLVEFRPSSSNSSAQTQVKSTNSPLHSQEADMETSSTASASSRSEGEPDRDSAYGSCDSDDLDPRYSSLRDYHRRRSFGENSKFKTILSSLSSEKEPSALVAALTELCEVLSFCTEDSPSSMLADSFSPILVKLARHNSNPDIMLLAIRAITYLCDVFPRSSGFLVRHDAIHALCEKLMAIEYMDVAEQCLQALEKISRDQPLACLQAGAIGAVLNLIDFLSTSMQRVALSIVVNICRRLPSENHSLFMEAVPVLCNLLQYEDRQLVESVATCLIKIVDQVSQYQEMLYETCKHGLVNQAVHIISLNARTTLSQAVYNGIIGMLVKLCSGSANAFRTLHELNICGILKDVLSTGDLSHGVSSPHQANGHSIQVHEVLKLLNEVVPSSSNSEYMQQISEKEAFLADNPVFIRRLGMEMLPLLIQMVNSGANLYVCFCCLSVINNFFALCTSDILAEVLADTNFSSFLAGVFTRKEQHLLIMALRIAETCLQKLSDVFLNSFMKEGVCFAIDALLKPEETSHKMFPTYDGSELLLDPSQRSGFRGVPRCFCYVLDTGQPSTCETVVCKLEKDAVRRLAMHIRTSYFSPELCNSGPLTDILQKLRALSAALTDLASTSLCDSPAQYEEKFHSILSQIMEKLGGREAISTFEFIESGILKSLVRYLSSGLSMHEEVDPQTESHDLYIVEKRFEVLARLLLSSSKTLDDELPLMSLTKKLQRALSSLENFPIILSNSKQRNSYALVPEARYLSHPCFKVRFLKEEGEACLSDSSQDVLTVDPFSSLDSIERYLYSKVTRKGKRGKKSIKDKEELIPAAIPTDTSLSPGRSPESDGTPAILPEEVEGHLLQPTLVQADCERLSGGAGVTSNIDTSGSESKFPKGDDVMTTHSPSSSSDASVLPKLVLCLEGQELDLSDTLYQAVLQQQMKTENEIIAGSNLWSEVHTVTYRLAKAKSSSSLACSYSSKAEKTGGTHCLSRLFSRKLATDLKRPGAVYDIIILLKSMHLLHRSSFELLSRERMSAFSEGRVNDLHYLKAAVPYMLQSEFVSSKLTEKLEQQMRDPLISSTGALAPWCIQLMGSCPFLFSFEVRCKYFQLAAFGRSLAQSCVPSRGSSDGSIDRRRNGGAGLARKKLLVYRDRIMASAAEVMDLYASKKEPIEVEFDDEVGTGLGPTLEFYTLVSHEFQKAGHGMWRDDHVLSSSNGSLHSLGSGILTSSLGVFPCPWSTTLDESGDAKFAEVINKFFILGRVVAKALQDGRVLDFHFSKTFYKLIIGQDLNLFDIHSFDPKLGQTLLEFQALVDKRKFMESVHRENTAYEYGSCFWNRSFEDLCLDFSLPGYPDYVLSPDANHSMVNMSNLEDYVSLVVDATIKTGISRQVEAFKSGFNEVFPVRHLEIFSEEELERLLCGEHDSWALNDLLDNIKFDHGYTASSPPVLNLLEIVQEFDQEQRRAFLQFVTGAPRLPPGGLASLKPKLTIVRKHCSKVADEELPSVMTCANYLKLPPYSSKEKMREKVLYAIREGQGSFHLS
ncbi:E3 ubiquitin-protein ligase UPL4 [Punica granatum]|uniref:HECT-type E3 ubiquitin transferase n=1 Tax=Punica granatum TaxID=22663 RepID=A0A6P8DM02_PUNGR|nr:E3 ubiquitin-protein ligase UPL4 [Punica granatum]